MQWEQENQDVAKHWGDLKLSLAKRTEEIACDFAIKNTEEENSDL